MATLALLPGLIAFIVGYVRTPARAFLWVYLPTLLLVPEYYRWTVPLLPKMTPSHAAIVGVMAAAVLKRKLNWRFTPMDALVLALVFSTSISEYINTNYKEAQNLTFDMLAWLFLPYLAAKVFVEPLHLRVAFAKRLVFLLFIVSLVSIYEFRFGRSAFRLPFDPFFPGQGSGWVTTFRYGFARIAGPYGHAILAGVILVVGFRIQRWLEWGGHWEPHFKHFKHLPFSKARIITWGLVAGSVMTMCRGPWLGGALATLVVTVGRARNRKLATRIALAAAILIGIPAYVAFHAYVSVGRAGAKSESQETAAYRKELMDKYTVIAEQKSFLGWGRNTWPKVHGMESIDNYYLQLTLMHGLLALTLFAAINIIMMVRLSLRAIKLSSGRSDEATLAFTLLSIYAAVAFSIATVYMGNQLLPLLAVITGWSEGFLQSRIGEGTSVSSREPKTGTEFRFARVVT